MKFVDMEVNRNGTLYTFTFVFADARKKGKTNRVIKKQTIELEDSNEKTIAMALREMANRIEKVV